MEEIDRYAEPGMNGLFCDILWADPAEAHVGDSASRLAHSSSLPLLLLQDDFTANPSRGCSVRFSETAAARFLDANNLSGLIRGHEVVESGVLYQFAGRVITVFSAPNYCGRYVNRAAYLVVDGGTMTACQFDPAPNQPEPVAFESVSSVSRASILETCPCVVLFL